ncbi:hypothetical protein BN946_scf184999.g79 [Trametes cinnabarina]|uniref:Uncharacterized protein n=1 Tax=Pycnoporus cinnabarinus TaxID=5643 RepID=A0A060SDG6_PYCCI|nr:hypothetical protein BN946_scf184999.g79 [Trametes cinnabarina]
MGALSELYLSTLGAALDVAFRSLPDLAVELAIDMLTDPRSEPHSLGRSLALAPLADIDEEGAVRYRDAFVEAWRMIDPSTAAASLPPYPCSTAASSEETELVQSLGYRPILVQTHVRQILEASQAYPSIKMHAESLLLGSPGSAQDPAGTDRLIAALTLLFPALEGDIVSIRRYDRPYPRVLWDSGTQMFVMSGSLGCAEHLTDNRTEPCFCWVGSALLDAVASWRAKTASDGGGGQHISDEAVFHALLRCVGSDAGDEERLQQSTSSWSSYSSGKACSEEEVRARLPCAEDAGSGELEYIDPTGPPPVRPSSSQFSHPSAADATAH